jgi:FkbH-like protein
MICVSTRDSIPDWSELKFAEMQTSDYSSYTKLCRQRRNIEQVTDIPYRKSVKLALLGSASTEFLPDILEFSLECQGIQCRIFTAPFNTYAFEMLDPDSATAKFQPDVVMLVNSPFNQPEWPELDTDATDVDSMIERTAEYWLGLCKAVHANTGCEVVFDNFPQLPWKPNGNLSAKLSIDKNNYISRLNHLIGQKAPSYVHINDVAWMSSHYGVSNWLDLKYWHHAKLPVSFDCIVPYIKNSSRIISSLYGSTRKVLVLDLDNTLWGGVIGDDGLESIKVGQGSPDGEAFLSFQKYIGQLKAHGVLLAVCSKNDDVAARLPFEKHPEMFLRIDDFVCFMANWEAKPDNLIEMSKNLNLGLDSFVFIDDNPAERELMRAQLPEVLTIELNDDPADYPSLIDKQSPFETTSFNDDDINRTSNYQENIKRETLKTSASDYNDYLKSLEQKAVICDFEDARLDRISQLINKTNQFNLTTLRKTRSEVESMMNDENHLSIYLQLSDKFGDNGIIAVVYGTWTDDALDLHGWLMSCRVLKRGVEHLTCNYLVEQARNMKKRFIRGTYIPTDRNSMVANLYSELGFDMIQELDDGTTKWVLDIDSYRPASHLITKQVI